jgi:5-methylcytosine-specific restriction endonuclease McrA
MSIEKYKREERLTCFERDVFTCQTCGRTANDKQIQAAHIVKNSRANRERYGEYVMYNHALLKTACSLSCNNRLEARMHKDQSGAYWAALREAVINCERRGLPTVGKK